MRSFLTVSIARNVGMVVAVFGMLIAGTWAAVKSATDHLLYQNATSTASGWARYLAENVGDLEQIAAGEQPSTTSMTFFKGARRGGQVFRYEIFNRQGYSQLASDQDKIAPVEISEFSIDAARSIAGAQPVVAVKEGNSPDLPSFYAQAYVPIFVDRRPIAIVAAYVDQTDQRDNFYRTFLIEALLLCLMTGLSFLIPMIAWLQRTKEKQQADRHIRFLAYHDALTGLANRTQLIEKLQTALAVPASRGGGFAVHFIDLDRFKEVNDTFGHDGGDFLLKAVAERLRAETRLDDVVARLGGDEFVVIQSSADGKDEAGAFANRLISALRTPINFNEHELTATISIGSALAPADGADPERLLKCADLALYEAKANGRDCVRFFLPEMDGALQARIDLERTLRHAVLHERFVLHYQPVFEAKASHQLRGFEALLRLPREDGTLIPPMAFIPVAEDIRLIGEIGIWVLREACRTAATWPDHLTIAVNLSAAQFELGSVSAIVAAALGETGLAPARLGLEITETLLLGNSEAILDELRTIKAMGVAIAMDDFGTGYSSLSYLWRFPFDKIKIDRSFMQGFDASGQDAQAVVKTIIALGRELDMLVTVEGVETEQQSVFLSGTDADLVQGFFFSKPIPDTEIAAGLITNFQKMLPIRPSANAGKPELEIITSAAQQ
jgi:diguanylate cyclase (GGDEF)-like protein